MNRLIIIALLLLVSASVFAQIERSEKRGIAYGNHSRADMAAISEGLSWWYNWYHQPDAAVAAVYQDYNMEFVPMTWNNSFNETGLRAFYTNHPEAKYLLAFNEPNFLQQANMKPSQVAAAWPRLEAIAEDFGLEIVGPAVNWCGSCVSEGGVTFTNPYAYLDTFFSICPDCKVDYIAVHNYMCYTSALSNYIEGFKKYGKKIWLTEYACWDQPVITLDMQKNLMKTSIDYLENDTMVFRYAWFTGNRSGAFPYLDIFAPTSGKLTELGEFYVSYRAYVPDTSYYTLIPKRIEAEHYSTMSGISTELVTDFDGGDNVNNIGAGDWLEYNIEVPSDDSYFFYLRIAGNATKIIVRLDGENIDTLEITASGGLQIWKTREFQLELPEGKHKLELFAQSGGFNLNWIALTDHKNTPPTIDAGIDQSITLPVNSITMTVEGNDPDDDVLKYKWTKLVGPASLNIKNPESAITEISDLTQGKYTFRVYISDGIESTFDQVAVNVISTIGLNDTKAHFSNVYPNPVEDILYIQNEGFSASTDIVVTDLTGRLIVRKTLYDGNDMIEMDLSSLKHGYYILRITRESNTSTHSIIKL